MQIEDFEKVPKCGWRSRKPVTTVLGDLFVELTATPNETMLKLANDLVDVAKTHGWLLLDSIYDHYRSVGEGGLEFWRVPSGLGRDEVMSQVESVTLCVSRNDSCIHVIPKWDLEHHLFMRFADGQFVWFDPMGE